MSPVWVLVVFFGYFATLIGIAGVRARQMREMSDYVLGRRNVGSFTSALSSASSSTSGWTMLVFPALAFTNGLVEMWSVLAIAVTIWLAWAVMAKRLRRYTIATDDALTLPEFFEKRFDDRTGIIRTVSALITLFFITLWGSFSGGPWGVLDAEPGAPGFVAATLAAVIVTLLTRPPSPEIADRFDRVVAPRTGARGSAVSPTGKPFSAGVRQSSNLKLTMFPISPSPLPTLRRTVAILLPAIVLLAVAAAARLSPPSTGEASLLALIPRRPPENSMTTASERSIKTAPAPGLNPSA